jgi:hypothetical protein
MVKPSCLVAYGSMDNCSTFSMVTKITFMGNILKGTKTPIMQIMNNCHFNWLIIYTNTPM